MPHNEPMKPRYRVRPSDVAPYSPANHSGTRNYRLIGRETVAAGEACFFPAGAPQLLRVTSARARVLVVYAPPYEERPARVLRDGER